MFMPNSFDSLIIHTDAKAFLGETNVSEGYFLVLTTDASIGFESEVVSRREVSRKDYPCSFPVKSQGRTWDKLVEEINFILLIKLLSRCEDWNIT